MASLACVVFLAALLGVPNRDAPLQVSVIAFAMAIPLLAWSFTIISSASGPGLGKGNELLATGPQVGGRIVGEGQGTVAVVVGVTAVVVHLNSVAALLGYGTLVARGFSASPWLWCTPSHG